MENAAVKKITRREEKGILCPRCGITKDNWTGNNGEGFEKNGLIYCCDWCAANSGCICLEGTDLAT